MASKKPAKRQETQTAPKHSFRVDRQPPHTPPAKLQVDSEWLLAQVKRTDFGVSALSRALRDDAKDAGNPHLISKFISGQRDITAGEVISLAKLLGVPLAELCRRIGYDIGLTVPELLDAAKRENVSLTRTVREHGYEWARASVNIMGGVGLGGRVTLADLGQTAGHNNTSTDTRAVRILDECGAEGLRDGLLFFEATEDRDESTFFGRLSVFTFAGAPLQPVVGVVQDVPRAGVVRIKPLGNDQSEDFRQLQTAKVVTWIKLESE